MASEGFTPAPLNPTERRAVSAALVLALLLGAVLLIANLLSGGPSHSLYASFEDVNQITGGQQVRIAGRAVGTIGSVRLVNGQPVVRLDISDSSVWPLPQGTRARIRWGSTDSYLWRYIELLPGPRSDPPLPNGAPIGIIDTTTPFELDQAYRLFRGRTLNDTAALVTELAQTFGPRAGALSNGLAAAPGGLDATANLLQGLGADQQALRTLVVSGNATVRALATRDSELGPLVTDAAGTFDTLARTASAEQQSLDRLPPTLRNATSTFTRLDTSLGRLNTLVDDVRPGAVALQGLAVSAAPAFTELRRVAPLATSTLRQGVQLASPLDGLLTSGTPFLTRFGSDLTQFAPMLGCLRPYSPEITGFLEDWTGFSKDFDSLGHYARSVPLALIQSLPTGTPFDSQQVLATSTLHYAFPRPPGLGAGQPWFQPQCGAGPSSVNAADDPERGFKP